MKTRGLILTTASLAVLLWSGSAWAYTTLYGCDSAWPESDLPVPYYVNEEAPTTLDIDTVRRIYRDSFAVWGEPCCSSFSATDAGLTTLTGEDNRDDQWTVSFIFDDWPSLWGNPEEVLGVTMTMVDNACRINTSDVVFNAINWSFVDRAPRRMNEADLVSIATHEFGHFLGLGHTSVYGATMYPAYEGGTALRSLHQDDIDGVCHLYETPCSCISDADCSGEQECIDSVCQIPPCESHSDCDTGMICGPTGDCVFPPCSDDGDCFAGYVCDDDGACVPDADCPICAECSSNADCGANGICIPAGYIGDTALCSSWCNSGADCPGNTECFTVPTGQGDVSLCFNSDADTRGPCPSDFVCLDDDTDLCAGVTCGEGEVCNPSTGQCQGTGGDCVVCESCSGTSPNECGEDGSCLQFVGGPSVCSVPCAVDGACPGNSVCFTLEDEEGTAQNWCLNSNANSVGICAGGWVCETDPVNLCEGVTCPGDQYCNVETGLCEGGSTSEPDAGFPDVSNPDGGTSGVTPAEDGDGNTVGGCGCSSTSTPAPYHAVWLLALLGFLGTIRRRSNT